MGKSHTLTSCANGWLYIYLYNRHLRHREWQLTAGEFVYLRAQSPWSVVGVTDPPLPVGLFSFPFSFILLSFPFTVLNRLLFVARSGFNLLFVFSFLCFGCLFVSKKCVVVWHHWCQLGGPVCLVGSRWPLAFWSFPHTSPLQYPCKGCRRSG